MGLRIRKATREDLDAVEALYNALNDYLAVHENGPRWSRGVYPLREHAEEGLAEGQLYVAELDGHIAGTVIYQEEQGDVYRQVDWQLPFETPAVVIHILAVHPDFFRQGVASALLDYAAEFGRSHGARTVRLDTYEENTAACRLYERCGFRKMARIDLGLEEIYGLKWYFAYEKVISD